MMVSDDYQKKLDALRTVIERAEGAPFSIEPELAAITKDVVPNLATDLLMSLSDDAHSGAMYALIHEAERLPGHTPQRYVSIVLSLLPDLIRAAPNWALGLVRRIMNTDETFAELLRQVRESPPSIKETVQEISSMNDAISPDFIAQPAKEKLALAAM